MKRIVISLMCITGSMLCMESPMPQNRHFLTDLMRTYQEKKPLNVESKSQATLIDIKNWIDYARANEHARAELAREFNSTPEDIEFVLEILDAEIQNRAQTPAQSSLVGGQRPVLLKPTAKPAAARLPIKPGAKPMSIPRLKPVTTPAPAKPATTASPLGRILEQHKNAIQKQEGNFVQLKTVDQFALGNNIGPATCPVQALRNVIRLLQFAHSEAPAALALLPDAHDARTFLDEVGKCGVGTQWLTAEELGRILKSMKGAVGNLRNEISAFDTVQELSLYPEQLKALQDAFKQPNATHGFIIGTMDMSQHTGQRGHYFALVITKTGNNYLYLIADTAPASDHLDPNSYNYKRVRYLTDLITKGKSDINLDQELEKIADNRFKDILARALQRGVAFDYASLSKEELHGLQKVVAEAEKNKKEWKDRTRITDELQLDEAIALAKQRIQQRISQLK